MRKRGRNKKSKARNLVERLRDYSEWVLRFVHDFRVPFTNDLAERDLRMMKVQQKISGVNVIESLSSVFSGEPLLHKLLQTT